MITLAALAIAACVPIDAPQDQITAADFARVLPEWSAIPPNTGVAIAPIPGVVRTFRPSELRRLDERFALVTSRAGDVCFQRPVAPVTTDRMLEVMQAKLPGAHIEILEPSRVPAPRGVLDFPLSGLHSGFWYGYVKYGAGHKFTVWARIRATVTVKRIIASADLKPGRAVEAGQLRIEVRDEFPTMGGPIIGSLDEFVGLIPRRGIPEGTVVQKQWFSSPSLVKKGDIVKVEVVSGAAKLEAEGIAESTGALGETIAVLNPDSKRRFRARIESAGRVSVKGTL